MFSTVRYFIKTSLIFLFSGLMAGLFMSVMKNIYFIGNPQSLVSAHTHVIMIGSVMMMIMGVALWFFPRAAKEDTRYNPSVILFSYWLITSATAVRFIFEIADGYIFYKWISHLVTAASFLQVAAFGVFFYSMWGRIRSVGSHIREAKGERF